MTPEEKRVLNMLTAHVLVMHTALSEVMWHLPEPTRQAIARRLTATVGRYVEQHSDSLGPAGDRDMSDMLQGLLKALEGPAP